MTAILAIGCMMDIKDIDLTRFARRNPDAIDIIYDENVDLHGFLYGNVNDFLKKKGLSFSFYTPYLNGSENEGKFYFLRYKSNKIQTSSEIECESITFNDLMTEYPKIKQQFEETLTLLFEKVTHDLTIFSNVSF